MKVLWIINCCMPFIAEALGKKSQPIGGWLSGYVKQLTKQEEVELMILFPSDGGEQGEAGGVSFRAFPKNRKKNLPLQEEMFYKTLQQWQPHIIHLFGSELSHALSAITACERAGMLDRAVVSIQGLISVVARHYGAYLPKKEIYGNTLCDLLLRKNIYRTIRKCEKRGERERRALQKVSHVIGRTDWDAACTQQINPGVRYHFCNESLRDSFYGPSWSPDSCEKHSIFVSQSASPIKGFHLMLEAFVEIKKAYPDAKLYTTGKNILAPGLQNRLKESRYSRYLRTLIEKNGLAGSVFFLGSLSEEEMCQRFLCSHVFVSCSSIENSPNSVGEAMLLGVPVIASDVGGVKNMLTHEEEGFIYPADAPYMIPYYVNKIFSHPGMAKGLSENAKVKAEKTHDREENGKRLFSIYQSMLCESQEK